MVPRKKALFNARVEAWAHRPVVPIVYRELKSNKSDLIPSNKINFVVGTLTEDECELVEAVWCAYKKFSATRLREMTHKEKPWIVARGECKAGELCTSEITKEAMMRHFTSLANK